MGFPSRGCRGQARTSLGSHPVLRINISLIQAVVTNCKARGNLSIKVILTRCDGFLAGNIRPSYLAR